MSPFSRSRWTEPHSPRLFFRLRFRCSARAASSTTRDATGFLGGSAVAANAPRLFPVGGACGIPATARAIAANVTVTGATSDGLLRIHASDIGAPDATVINFRSGQTRANNATIALGPDAEFTVRFEAPNGEVHVIVDVVGWYE